MSRSSGHRGRAVRREETRAFTLLEVILVLVILSALAGLSVSGLLSWRRRSMHDACLAEVSLRLREARNFAMSGSVGSVVAIDTDMSVMRAWSFRPVALLSFEGPDRGGPYALKGSAREGAGRLGKGVDLAGGGEISLPAAGGFIGREGLAVRLYVLLVTPPTAQDGPWRLVRGGDAFAVEIRPGPVLSVRVGTWEGATRGGALVPGRWQEVAVTWIATGSDDEVGLSVDGIDCPLRTVSDSGDPATRPTARRGMKVPSQAPPVPGEMILGPLQGLLDEVTVLAVVAGEEYGIPGEFVFAGEAQRVHFAPSGGLDLRYHEKPAAICIAPSRFLEERVVTGRTHVREPLLPEGLPQEELSWVRVELSGRIRTDKAERPPERATVRSLPAGGAKGGGPGAGGERDGAERS